MKGRPRKIPRYAARRAPVKEGEDATLIYRSYSLKDKGVRSPHDTYSVLQRRDTELEVHVGGTRKRVLSRSEIAHYSRILERRDAAVRVCRRRERCRGQRAKAK